MAPGQGGFQAGDRVRLLTAVGGLLDCGLGRGVGRLGRRLLGAVGERRPFGWVAERLNAPVLKTGNGESRSWVQIPPHPFGFSRNLREVGSASGWPAEAAGRCPASLGAKLEASRAMGPKGRIGGGPPS